MAFECIRCGDCCKHIGYVHSIKEECGDYRFLLHNNYSGDDTIVIVDPDKIALFHDKSILETYPHSCPFFRYEKKSMTACCTIHTTRPGICQDYGCWRLLIIDHQGKRAGKITHKRTLISEDTVLSRLWEACIEEHPEPDDARWEERMIRILSGAGYIVRR